ncbi:hypothetical protein DACRYDRAFT_94486 [Dacryopinax primogenitus]|uniref:Uncharacterized protein n=1 Tax=Dacryopinax primogenitus (strain DJM 731) TaxID=1858805 RepID=M5G2A2_DACPD|nr:uncharacterized protein DACRYDRAFT_94486 [Dacryopinax primogenitus]EJU02819.1 hypothetical protein DACRYDRAFT_94486 [Dacryopinax primogenitus]
MVDELADDDDDDDDAASSVPGGTGALPPLHAHKSSSTRGGKGSRGPRKKRLAQIGERVMSPPPRQIGTEWVVHVSEGQTVPPSDDVMPPLPPPARGRGRGSRGGKRGVAGPGRGWRKGITNAKKAEWEAEAAALNNSNSTPDAFLSTMPPNSGSGSASGAGMFREYHPPSGELSAPSIPAPPLLQIKQDLAERPKHPTSSAKLSSQRSASAPYPPPIVQPTLPSQEIRYLPPEPRLEPGMAPTDGRGGLLMPIHGIPSRACPVQPAPKLPSNQPQQAPPQPIDRAGIKFKVRKWRNVSREIKGIGGTRFFVKTWLGDKESEYTRHRGMSGPTLGPMPAFPSRFKFKQEFNGSTGTGTPADRGTPMEGTAGNPVIVDLTDDVDMDSPAALPEGSIAVPP